MYRIADTCISFCSSWETETEPWRVTGAGPVQAGCPSCQGWRNAMLKRKSYPEVPVPMKVRRSSFLGRVKRRGIPSCWYSLSYGSPTWNLHVVPPVTTGDGRPIQAGCQSPSGRGDQSLE